MSDTGKTTLLISRQELKSKLEERITRGDNLLSDIPRNRQDIKNMSHNIERWNSFNEELLARSFTTEQYSDEYVYDGDVNVFITSNTTMDGFNELKDNVDRKIVILKSISDRLDLIPEPRTQNEQQGVSAGKFDVAVICALPEPEFAQVRRVTLGGIEWQEVPSTADDPQRYFTTECKTAHGNDLRIIAAFPNHMGMVPSAVLATKIVLKYNPKLVAMVGIAAGVKGHGRGYGDILIAEQTIDYRSGKVQSIDGKQIFSPSSNPLPISSTLLSALRSRSSNQKDLNAIVAAWPTKHPETHLSYHFGPLGSADLVVNDEKIVAEALKHSRKLIGIDMESYAIHRACNDSVSPPPACLTMKSVCDFGSNKNDAWQDYAAFTSAQFFFRFLISDWEKLHL